MLLNKPSLLGHKPKATKTIVEPEPSIFFARQFQARTKKCLFVFTPSVMVIQRHHCNKHTHTQTDTDTFCICLNLIVSVIQMFATSHFFFAAVRSTVC